MSKSKLGLFVTAAAAAGTLIYAACDFSKKQQIPQTGNVNGYYNIPQMSVWNDKNVVEDNTVFGLFANQSYGSSGMEDSFTRTTNPNNGYWLTVEDIINEVETNNIALSEKDTDLITSLYKKS